MMCAWRRPALTVFLSAIANLGLEMELIGNFDHFHFHFHEEEMEMVTKFWKWKIRVAILGIDLVRNGTKSVQNRLNSQRSFDWRDAFLSKLRNFQNHFHFHFHHFHFHF